MHCNIWHNNKIMQYKFMWPVLDSHTSHKWISHINLSPYGINYSYCHSRTRYQEYQEFNAENYYKCEARVAMKQWCFTGIAFYYGNNEFIIWQTCRMIGLYIATLPGNKKSISNIASNGDCPTIKWTNKKPTTEWNSCKQSQRDVCG